MQLLKLKPTDKPVKEYYSLLGKYHDLSIDHEGAVRGAFQSLLENCARKFDWTLIAEWKIKRPKQHPISVDGALVDGFKLTHGFWEAKDTKDDLPNEVKKKFAVGYPKNNILFQAPNRAILYQDGKQILDEDITKAENLIGTLKTFFEYRAPQYENWEQAVEEFRDRVPELAGGLVMLIERERTSNKRFIGAFAEFMELCRAAVNPNLSEKAVEEMLIQHLLTERIFSKVFDNPDFARRNVIAHEIEKVIDALTSQSFNRSAFLSKLDRFYLAIEETAITIDDFSQKQGFLNTVYERFFQGFSVKVADTHGIVYTPQPIVGFMARSIVEILQREFGKSLGDKGVHLLDPFVGTGNFVVRLMQEIPKTALEYKYQHELHCNEVMLLPYYIASMNIEHEYYEKTGQYQPFDGICLVDTFELAEDHTITMFTTENTERVERQKRTPIFVFVGNPPYNAGQVNENDNNKNRKYLTLDKRVSETYAKDSRATLTRKVDDPYVKAIRWASDRIGEEGVVAFVTNNSFLDKISFDGMRKHLAQDFTRIYTLNLQGDVRKDSMHEGIPIGEEHTVFGLAAMVGITITFLVRSKSHTDHKIYYAEVDWRAKRKEKFEMIEKAQSVYGVDWKEVQPDANYTWLTEGMRDDFKNFIPIGSKDAKASKAAAEPTIFKTYSLGVSTNRDATAYDFDSNKLIQKVRRFSEHYNAEVSRYQQQGRPKDVDGFLTYDSIKWSRNLKRDFRMLKTLRFDESNIRQSVYRPFTSKYLYFADTVVDERGKNYLFFSTASRQDNRVICISDKGARAPFSVMMVDAPADLHLCASTDAFQCFPFYIYNEVGTNRHENITDWTLKQYRAHYNDTSITKWEIFYYVYALLHHPEYRTRYAANLKRDLPRIPFAPEFKAYAQAGERLAELHVNYESQPEYKLKMIEDREQQLDWHVEKMRLSKDKTQITYNSFLTLAGIPSEAFEYRLGNRLALEWVIDQYRIKTDERSGITSDPNRADDPQYIVRLVKQVITVSLETMKIVKGLPKLPSP